MKALLLLALAATLSLPVFAKAEPAASANSQMDEMTSSVNDPLFLNDLSDELSLFTEDETTPVTEEDESLRPRRMWTCVARDRGGHRFFGRSYALSQARRTAYRHCMRFHSRQPRPWASCRIIRCSPRYF